MLNKAEATAYHTIEPALSRFLARTLDELYPQSFEQWARHLDYFPSGRSTLAELEVSQLLKLIERNIKIGYNRIPTLLFDKYHISPNLLSYVKYVKAVRNKHAHESFISSQEQLADLIIIKCLISLLSSLSHLVTAEDEEFNRDLATLITSYHDRAIEVEAIPITQMKEPSSEVIEAINTLTTNIDRRLSLIERSLEQAHNITTIETQPAISIESPNIPLLQIGQVEQRLDEQATILAGFSERLTLLQSATQVLYEQQQLLVEQLNLEDEAGNSDELHEELEDEGEEYDEEEVYEEEIRNEETVPTTYSVSEARDRLIGLRWRIWSELGTGPSEDGLLRKRMIDYFINGRITSEDNMFRQIPTRDLGRLDPRQYIYLPEVFTIIENMEE